MTLASASISLLLATSLLVACGGEAEDSTSDSEDADSSDGDDGDSGDGDSGDGDSGDDGDGDSGDGDSPACTDLYAYGLTVIVYGGATDSGPGTGGSSGAEKIPLPPETGGTTGNEECFATGTATDGDYTETLSCYVQGEDCRCVGAGERPGTYTVEVMRGEARATVYEVVVEADECHVIGELVEIPPL